jgi:hypothetical protein
MRIKIRLIRIIAIKIVNSKLNTSSVPIGLTGPVIRDMYVPVVFSTLNIFPVCYHVIMVHTWYMVLCVGVSILLSYSMI